MTLKDLFECVSDTQEVDAVKNLTILATQSKTNGCSAPNAVRRWMRRRTNDNRD